jgi:hypothetical protein
MTRSTVLWNADERRYRAPVRLVVGFLTVALLAVLGTVTAELVAAVLWPDPLTALACVLAYVRVVGGSLRIHPALLRPAFRGDDAVGTGVVEVSTGSEASPPPR